MYVSIFLGSSGFELLRVDVHGTYSIIRPHSAASATRRRGYSHFVCCGFVARSCSADILERGVRRVIEGYIGRVIGGPEMTSHVMKNGAGAGGFQMGVGGTGRCFNGAEFVRWGGMRRRLFILVSVCNGKER